MPLQVKAVFLWALALAATVCQTGNPGEYGTSPGRTTLGQAEGQPGSAGLTREQVLAIAREAIREALKNKGAVFPVPWLDDDRMGAVGMDPDTPGKWLVGWGGNPTGGGYHGGIVIDQVTGKAESVHIGWHGR